MHQTNRLWMVFLVALLVSGCKTSFVATDGPLFSAAPKPSVNSNKSVIFIYRTDLREGFASERVIYLNNERILSIDSRGYTWVVVEPGKQIIESQIPWSKRDIYAKYIPNIIELETKPGETYYIHLAIGVDIEGSSTGVSFVGSTPIVTTTPNVSYSKSLLLEEERLALSRLRNYRYQQPE